MLVILLKFVHLVINNNHSLNIFNTLMVVKGIVPSTCKVIFALKVNVYLQNMSIKVV